MKANPNSLISKFTDVNTEIIKITKKIQSIDSFHERVENSLKEEANLRQNIEKKTFHMNETFNGKFASLRKGFDDLVNVFTEQIENLKSNFSEDTQRSKQNLFLKFEETLKRFDLNEKNSIETFNELTVYKSENDMKVNRLEQNIQKEMREMRKEISNNNMKTEMLEKKINENIVGIQSDLSGLIKDINYVKNEIEMVKNFKENTILNFKDISEEFVRNEGSFNKMSNKILANIHEFESKVSLFEQTFSMHNENFANIKKDIYAQIYDTNLNINNKFKLLNEAIFDKIEGCDKRIDTFQNSLISENDKFTSFISDQIDDSQKNLKKLIEFYNEDKDLLKNKVTIR